MFIRIAPEREEYYYYHHNCGGQISVGKMGRRHVILCQGCGTYTPFTRKENATLAIMGKVYTSTNEEITEGN